MRNAVNRGVVRSSKKEVFLDALLDLVGINLHICGISIDLVIASDVFHFGNVPFELSPEAAISR